MLNEAGIWPKTRIQEFLFLFAGSGTKFVESIPRPPLVPSAGRQFAPELIDYHPPALETDHHAPPTPYHCRDAVAVLQRGDRAVFLRPGGGSRAQSDAAKLGAAEQQFFEKQVRPLLIKHCYQCHSSQAKVLKGGLRLDSRGGWMKGGDSGPAVVPGRRTRAC